MIRPLIRRASVTAAALFSALALSVTQANAASPAYNTTIIYLTANPTPANVSCVSRDIYLAAGNYSWHQLHNDLGADGKNIWLAAGRYHMEDCLNGVAHEWGGYYRHTSRLVPPAGVGPAATLESTWSLPYEAHYTYGTFLDPWF
ncbi:hypothetical protein ACIP6Q_20300 [Streptomyces bobili]|uniref:hypothetical protein n=1 Tax=Streptomyces bobili TaxID=67280 RepID=UPI00381FE538